MFTRFLQEKNTRNQRERERNKSNYSHVVSSMPEFLFYKKNLSFNPLLFNRRHSTQSFPPTAQHAWSPVGIVLKSDTSTRQHHLHLLSLPVGVTRPLQFWAIADPIQQWLEESRDFDSSIARRGAEQLVWTGQVFFFFLPLSCLHIFNPTMDVVWVAEGVCTLMMTM